MTPRLGLAGRSWAGLIGGACLLGSVAACSSTGSDGTAADAGRGNTVTRHQGTSTSGADGGCADEESNRAAPPQHVDPGTTMDYTGVPPVSGKHWAQWPDLGKTLYVADERPELGELVHSEEHGWTIVWYDDSIAGDDAAMESLRGVASEVDAAELTKVVFVPWTSADGAAFPHRAHVAVTHWGNEDDGTEWRQFCREPSAAAVTAFSQRHPSSESREPDAP